MSEEITIGKDQLYLLIKLFKEKRAKITDEGKRKKYQIKKRLLEQILHYNGIAELIQQIKEEQYENR
jgi:hypothetical protein